MNKIIGYEYEVILCFLLKYHKIEMSLRTLKERLKSLGLQQRKLLDSNNQDVRARIQEELDGPGCLSGVKASSYKSDMLTRNGPRRVR